MSPVAEYLEKTGCATAAAIARDCRLNPAAVARELKRLVAAGRARLMFTGGWKRPPVGGARERT